MTRIPLAPLLLGLAGLIPFAWGALTTLAPQIGLWSLEILGGRFTGPYVGLSYGQVILAFMSGVLWGFATKAEGARAAAGYALSVIPALWAFFMVGGGPVSAAVNLIAGFAGLLALDAAFSGWGLAPPWWMTLRVILTAGVALCLAPVALMGG
ncbi:DUF3429 domain-containing protein [Wenxinia saemankumensis]|uniref:DUF3429 domain-containing protein n=1 Tax=Wenxinia saemankumensis TaxID=1447782 RepID=A0A1M6EJ26_9RHOB|nr:DUF3429 domain-containing protein [Wenxinia saemankumensis]SHI85487.1 Protein of unknown function [Wenxinia saemankumensis]